jgi:hypothetical protein
VVVLNEGQIKTRGGVECGLIEALEEAAIIAEHFGFDQEGVRDGCGCDAHRFRFFIDQCLP